MDIVQELRERNEYLEETVASLKRQMGLDADMAFAVRCREVFGMTKGQAKLLRVLMAARAASRETLFAALYSDKLEQPDIKILDTVTCNIRPKLSRHGISIKTVWGQGYALSPENKARIEALLA